MYNTKSNHLKAVSHILEFRMYAAYILQFKSQLGLSKSDVAAFEGRGIIPFIDEDDEHFLSLFV